MPCPRIVRTNSVPEPGRYTCEVVLTFADYEEVQLTDITVDVERYYFSGEIARNHAIVTLHGVDPTKQLKAVALCLEGDHLFGGDVEVGADLEDDTSAQSTRLLLNGRASNGYYV